MQTAYCQHCRESYYSDLMRECCVVTRDDRDRPTLHRVLACGACALELIRAAHGNPRYEFERGTVAHGMYVRCSQIRAMRRTNGDES